MTKIGIIALAVAGVASAFAATLPRQVEYIESNDGSSHYIDLGIVGRGGLEVESKMSYVKLPKDAVYVGSRAGSGDKRAYFIAYATDSSRGVYYGYTTYGGASPACLLNAGQVYTIDTKYLAGNQTISVDGSVVLQKTIATDYNTGRNLYLFGLNNAGTANSFVSARCYSLKIWDYKVSGQVGEQVLVRDFVPYLDKDGKPCLFERVEKKWYYPGSADKNLGYAEITGGGEEVDYRNHYVEYIESTGAQYIDTGIAAATKLRAVMDMAYTVKPSNSCFLGAYSSNTTVNRLYFCYYYDVKDTDGTFGWALNTSNQLNPRFTAVKDTRYTVQIDMFRDKRGLTIDEVQQTPYDTSTIDMVSDSLNLYLFGMNEKGKASTFSKARCYGIKIYGSDDGFSTSELTLLADFRPYVDAAGKPGMRDAVSGNMFYNKGSGADFLYGEIVEGEDDDDAGVVVTADGVPASAVDPVPGSYFNREVGQSYTYTAHECEYAGNLAYKCRGYTTATKDGDSWTAESALVNALACVHEFDGTWWQINWKYDCLGAHLVANAPDGASVQFASAVTPELEGYYPAGTEVTMTASETDGNGGVFFGWKSSVAGSAIAKNRALTVTVADDGVSYTAYYKHAWTVASESADVKTITDGLWVADVKVADGEGELAGYSCGCELAEFDLSGVEADLGFKVTKMKDWPPNGDGTGHKPPMYMTSFIAPDVTYVGNYSFNGGVNLERAVFSENLNHVGTSAFYICGKLESITPSLSKIASQVVFGDDIETADKPVGSYAFSKCAKLGAGDFVIVRNDDVTFPPSFFRETAMTTLDMSGCKGVVGFKPEAREENGNGAFASSANLVSVVLPPKLANLPRFMFSFCAALDEVRVTGVLPTPDKIGRFYETKDLHLKFLVPYELNKTVVEDLQLRDPTDDEKDAVDFPAKEFAAGRLLGVFDTPTSGWGEPKEQGTARFWVIDKPAPGRGTMLMLK